MRKIGYSIVDIIDKVISIKRKVQGIYKGILQEDNVDQSIKVIANALEKEQERHIKYYDQLKYKIENTDNADIEEIDFVIYNKISYLVNEYKNKVYILNVKPKSIGEIWKIALDFEKENNALIINIQGRLVKKAVDVDSKTYKILSQMLEYEKKYIEFLKRYLN
ncbi:hypothetical protein OW763_16210 [Clostridium aestuarii]|uniref:Rubrerythrin diiron-binding domain-containing protein n=1 Tax=Clostridium aestuarii TaxID=338193 RepID=A0ABT4D769_9CLOT|nr:hypothetical protein [Clostridium aestuarii]MCY6485858.1 hypothetical protein [Clostridium aestuarii]